MRASFLPTNHFTSFLFTAVLLLSACQPGQTDQAGQNNQPGQATSQDQAGQPNQTEQSDNPTVFRIAMLGDAEPKPLAEFPNMAAAITQINTLHASEPFDFAIGVGDIAHKGTLIQYEAATAELTRLEPAFYPIMGNEERESTVERYLEYAEQWNPEVTETRYVHEHEKVAFVYASPDEGRDFYDEGAAWVRDQVEALAPKPVVLVVHGAQVGAYPENPDKGITNELFAREVVGQPNLAVMITGDLHMDMERVVHSKQVGNTHYLHVPGVERTKIPDETNHTPMFRVMEINADGLTTVHTYAVGESEPRASLSYSFAMPGW
ncbi:MAG: hypothetical protein RI513_00725 [Balneolaceae bacterium]|nr:hypothetical protein [Balneolaceae bacterium]MDR9446673.1 hypothetical protein [Balneolaceae bacterium]